METRKSIQNRFEIFCGNTGGIDSWLTEIQDPLILESLCNLQETPLTRARSNQLLTLAHEAPISDAMFK